MKKRLTYDQSLCWSCWKDRHTDHKKNVGCPCDRPSCKEEEVQRGS